MCEIKLPFNCECFDTCFWVSALIIPLLTFLVLRLFRPRLRIDKLKVEEKLIKITVYNRGFMDASNLRIEICVLEGTSTYHFEPDHENFLILPGKSFLGKQKDNSKVFVCRKASQSAISYYRHEIDQEISDETVFISLLQKISNGSNLRVRAFAINNFTGLGKSFEQIF